MQAFPGRCGEDVCRRRLPVPDGPKKMMFGRFPLSAILRSSFPSPRMCCWPTTSSSVLGRSLSAKGARTWRHSFSAALLVERVLVAQRGDGGADLVRLFRIFGCGHIDELRNLPEVVLVEAARRRRGRADADAACDKRASAGRRGWRFC